MAIALNAGDHSGSQYFRSMVAVLGGLVAGAALSVGTDALLRATGLFPLVDVPSSPLLLLGTVYRSIYMVAGSYLAARLAPHHRMEHALALGVLGLALSLLGTVLAWGIGPAWYGRSLVVLSVPCGWVGGRLCEIRTARRPSEIG